MEIKLRKDGQPDGRVNNGGYPGTGAKKKEESEKVAPVTVYIPRCDIKKIGGIDVARNVAKLALEEISKKN